MIVNGGGDIAQGVALGTETETAATDTKTARGRERDGGMTTESVMGADTVHVAANTEGETTVLSPDEDVGETRSLPNHGRSPGTAADVIRGVDRHTRPRGDEAKCAHGPTFSNDHPIACSRKAFI